MPNLPLLQTQLDQIPGLLQEVQDLRSVTGSWRDQTYDISHIAPLEAHLTHWAQTTQAILKEELGREPAQTFRQTWDKRHRHLPYKEGLTQKLRDTGKHLRNLIAAHKEIASAQAALTDLWSLVHPAIEDVARTHFEAKNYNKAIQLAGKIAKADIDAPTSRQDALRKLIAISIPMYKAES